MRFRLFALLVLGSLICAPAAVAQEPGWSPQIITFGRQRQIIEATPIVKRPYRPLHFYGNTVRRRYYRGTASPSARSAPRESVTRGRGR